MCAEYLYSIFNRFRRVEFHPDISSPPRRDLSYNKMSRMSFEARSMRVKMYELNDIYESEDILIESHSCFDEFL